jgi:hypothetical protein
MARIVSPIGIITGKLGNVIFRRRGNKTYVCKAPEQYRIPTDPATIERKRKFARVGKIAVVINSIPLLKAVWTPGSNKSVTPYNQIFKQIFGMFPYIEIAPGFGFSVTDSSVIFGKSAIFVEAGISITNLGLNLSVEKSIIAVGILALSDPLKETYNEEMIVPLRSAKLPLLPENVPGSFIIPLTGLLKLKCDMYKTKKVSICLITLDDSDNPIHYSRTFS